MNLKEYSRITTVPIPNPAEPQDTINRKLIACILYLLKRDEDKETRLRTIEDKKSMGRDAIIRLIEEHA